MKFCLDRKEEGFAVCLSEDASNEGQVYNFRLAENEVLAPLDEGTLFDANLTENGTLTDVSVLAEETAARREAAKTRLHSLFARKKKG